MAMLSKNPATGETLKEFDEITDAELERRLQAAADAFASFRTTSFEQRAVWMTHAADILESESRRLGELMTTEMGKPVTQAVAEAEKCAWVCRYYAKQAASFLADEPVETGARSSWVKYQPLGPVLAVMPWNFPFWQLFRFAAPGLMAGNVGLLKHASNVPQCALEIEDIFQRAGFPDGVFQTLLIGAGRVDGVLDDARIRAATLTGSEPAGSAVAQRAGRRIKKTVLELGGSDPFVIMPSADMDAAVSTAVKARVQNNGQSCIAAKRFVLHEAIADEFTERFVQAMEALTVGDPMDGATDVGPLATEAIREELAKQVADSVAAGAELLTGGQLLDRPGWYYAPTVLASIPEDAPAAREETFGPVASLFVVHDIDEAIARANDTDFGLGAAAWTTDDGERQRFVDGLDAGCVFINGMVASDPRLPFGGVKHSGYGRELSIYGIREFVNIKTVSTT
ncbi:MAG: NAD-dependent succinate-semialdehyde dehydrogenase [Gemmatimonadota bacterium]|jgi:succinate-semialdehyde dehydrogenase/glutarate-semialdehyde dehydrogenase